MLRLAADENLNNDLVRGLLRRQPDRDIVRVQDAGLSGADDPTVLAWAAQQGRVLLTHDVSTITRYAYERGGRVSECQEYSRSAERFPSVWPLKTLCSWRSAASMMSGKVRYATYRCVDAHPSQARQQPASSCCRWGSLPHLHSITASSSNTVRLSMPACTP